MVSLKQLAAVGIGFAGGALVTLLVMRYDKQGEPEVEADRKAALSSTAKEDGARLRADYEQQIADLKRQLEAALSQAPSVGGTKAVVLPTTAEQFKRNQEARQSRVTAAQAEETNKLLAAGFTLDRINWIRERAQVLAAEFRQKSDQLRQQGNPDFNEELAHNVDSDIDLRRELGDDEYARYRQALGRSTGMKVGDVMSGGYGESVGIKVGDEVTSYNGVRVFNVGELNQQIVKHMKSGTSMAVEILRDGQSMRVSVPAGDMRIRPVPKSRTTEDLMRGQKQIEVLLQEAARRIDAGKRSTAATP